MQAGWQYIQSSKRIGNFLSTGVGTLNLGNPIDYYDYLIIDNFGSEELPQFLWKILCIIISKQKINNSSPVFNLN